MLSKKFLLDSTARSLRKHQENKVEEWCFINQLFLATSQTQATARLNFPQRRLTFGFYGPGPGFVPSHNLENPRSCHKENITIILENGRVENFCPDFVNFWKNFLKNYKNSTNLPKVLGFCDDVIIGQNPPPPSSSIVIIWKPPPPLGDDVICERPLTHRHLSSSRIVPVIGRLVLSVFSQ